MLAAITILSLAPADDLLAVPGTDKVHHIIAYSLLMFPVALVRPRNWLWIGLFFVAWGGTIEWLQPYFNRWGDWLDLLANCGGLLCGMAIARLSQSLAHCLAEQ